MQKNKKIINATPTVFNDIQFKSIIEVMVYKTLLQHGFNPQYELYRFTIWEGFRPTVPFYTRDKKKNNILNLKKLINITYSPDFYIEYEGLKIIIEAKGATNDVFPYKFKLFRQYIENLEDKDDYLIFEIFTKKQLLECVEIIKQYASNRQNEKSVETSTKKRSISR